LFEQPVVTPQKAQDSFGYDSLTNTFLIIYLNKIPRQSRMFAAFSLYSCRPTLRFSATQSLDRRAQIRHAPATTAPNMRGLKLGTFQEGVEQVRVQQPLPRI